MAVGPALEPMYILLRPDVSLAPAWFPIAVLLIPTSTADRAPSPIPTLYPPIAEVNAHCPIATVYPVQICFAAFSPTATTFGAEPDILAPACDPINILSSSSAILKVPPKVNFTPSKVKLLSALSSLLLEVAVVNLLLVWLSIVTLVFSPERFISWKSVLAISFRWSLNTAPFSFII